jgi:Recombination endonuclease VII.
MDTRLLRMQPRAANRLKTLYNLTLTQYGDMFKAQDGKCAICRRAQVGQLLSVDHNHKTGKVRGLLCTYCNTRLATVEDAAFVKAAKKYLHQSARNVV